MTKLKLGPIGDEKPVKVTAELPATLHRDLAAYADVLGRPIARSHEISPTWSSIPTGN